MREARCSYLQRRVRGIEFTNFDYFLKKGSYSFAVTVNFVVGLSMTFVSLGNCFLCQIHKPCIRVTIFSFTFIVSCEAAGSLHRQPLTCSHLLPFLLHIHHDISAPLSKCSKRRTAARRLFRPQYAENGEYIQATAHQTFESLLANYCGFYANKLLCRSQGKSFLN